MTELFLLRTFGNNFDLDKLAPPADEDANEDVRVFIKVNKLAHTHIKWERFCTFYLNVKEFLAINAEKFTSIKGVRIYCELSLKM